MVRFRAFCHSWPGEDKINAVMAKPKPNEVSLALTIQYVYFLRRRITS